MNADERRAGFRRLGQIALGLFGVVLVLSLVFTGLGSRGTEGFGRGAGVVGIFLVMGGVLAFGRTAPFRRTAGTYQRASAEDRKEAERLALGLFGAGIVFSVLALVLV